MALVAKTVNLVQSAYPFATGVERGTYALSVAAYVTLFVLNFLSITGTYVCPELKWVNFALITGSVGLALVGGARRSYMGLAKELILHAFPLMMISIFSITGIGSVGSGDSARYNMALGILLTQGIGAFVYYGGGIGCPLCVRSITLAFAPKENRQAVDELVLSEPSTPVASGPGDPPPGHDAIPMTLDPTPAPTLEGGYQEEETPLVVGSPHLPPINTTKLDDD